MIMEDSDAPHHLLLLRSFMAQGVVHKQPLLFAGPMKEPRLFLGTLPAVASSKEDGRQRGMGAGTNSDGRTSVCLEEEYLAVNLSPEKCYYFNVDLDM